MDDFDLKGFWLENQQCFDPFSTDKPRVPLYFMFDDHFILRTTKAEQIESYYFDPKYTLSVNRHCNDIMEREIGWGFCHADSLPYLKGGFEILMGAKLKIKNSIPWLTWDVKDIEDVKKIIRKIQKTDMKKDAIPDEWKEIKKHFEAETGKRLQFENSWTGPATLACNILGTTNVCIFIMEEPDVMKEFFETMCDKYIDYREAVVTFDNGKVDRNGIGINDDDCYLFSPALYEKFCAPFVDKFFKAFAPKAGQKRRQHSDSAMGHLMSILNDLGVNEVNFGPTVEPPEIRKAMPKAVIHGQMPPFTLRNGTAEEITNKARSYIEALASDGGYVASVAGVVAEGTPFENIRTYMRAVDKYGRYK